jgi:hypothetical protein
MHIHVKTSDWPEIGNLTCWSHVTGMSMITLRKYIQSGRLKASRQINNIVLIRKADLLECFKARIGGKAKQ